MFRESMRNRNRRLDELRNGAEESYFEERRELEADPPRFDFTHHTLRLIGIGALALGFVSLFLGILQ